MLGDQLSSVSSIAEWQISPLRSPAQVSPIDVSKLEVELANYPDRSKVNFVISGLRYGFRLGFNPLLVTLRPSPKNMPSALMQPAIIDDYLLNELKKGRVAGPFTAPLYKTSTSVALVRFPKSTSRENGV